jgi:hypothetical protein
MARAGPRFVSDKFDLSRCTQALETLYDEIAARGSLESCPPGSTGTLAAQTSN